MSNLDKYKEFYLNAPSSKVQEELDVIRKELRIILDKIDEKKKKGEKVDELESIEKELHSKFDFIFWELKDRKIKFGGFK